MLSYNRLAEKRRLKRRSQKGRKKVYGVTEAKGTEDFRKQGKSVQLSNIC